MLTPRPYQTESIDKCAAFLKAGNSGGICILPTGAGKSLVIAGLIKELGNERTLILQPSKEILAQNFEKYRAYGFYASVFSASMKRKEISRTVFATIGSITRHKGLFADFKYVIIDECHLVRAPKVRHESGKQIETHSMYSDFLTSNSHLRLMGFTATPYRLSTDGFGGSILKFITRTRPRLFNTVVHYVQNRFLFEHNFLSKLVYYEVGTFDRAKIKKNSTGADFDEKAARQYYEKINFAGTIVLCVRRLMEIRKNVLVFVRFIREAEYLAKTIPGAEYITGEMKAEKRDDILRRFKANKIKCLINIGVIAIGFDKPDLETVVVARETMSLAAYYQWCGRGLRLHPEKENCWIVDMCQNMKTFGKIEDLTIENEGAGKWVLTTRGGRRLTNEYFEKKKETPQLTLR